MRLRQVLTNLAVLAVSLVIGVAVAEAMLRMTDSRWELERRFFADKPEGVVYQRLENGLHALADFLKPFGVPAPREGQLDMAMARAPQEHLGNEAFQQIYQGGIYQPKAAAE